MKKFSVLLTVSTLLIASFACLALPMGSGEEPDDNNEEGFQQDTGEGFQNNGEQPAPTPTMSEGGGDLFAGDSGLPMISDAYNVVESPGTLSYKTMVSAEDIIAFYRSELGKEGYGEDSSAFVNFNSMVSMIFEKDGDFITVATVPAPDGGISVLVSLASQ